MTNETNLRLLGPQEVSEMVYLGLSTIYKLAAEGKIPCVRFGRSVRFLPEDVIRFIEENRTGYEDKRLSSDI